MSLSFIFTVALAAFSAVSAGPIANRALPSAAPASPTASAVKIVLGNDDGWAEANIRQFYQSLKSTGKDVILSAPAYNMSGTSSLDLPALLPLILPGEYNSIPAGSPPQGSDATDHRINYYASFPASAVEYGLNTLAPTFWGQGSKPDLVLAGPNVGSNLGIIVPLSGTVGATSAGLARGIPAIAFSGANGGFRSYTELKAGDISHVYAELALKVVDQVISSGKPYLPDGVQLNVNFADVAPGCDKSQYFKFYPSTVYPLLAPAWKCNGTAISNERAVMNKGCTVSVSAMSLLKTDVSVDVQEKVFTKLGGLFRC